MPDTRNFPGPVERRGETDLRLDLARAMQSSEARRAHLLLVVLIWLLILMLLREFMGGADARAPMLRARLVTIGVGIAYALVLTRVVRRANAGGRLMPRWFWIGTTLLESCFPTIALVELLRFASVDRVLMVTAPAMTVYLLFATISVLRLRPALSVIGGVSSGLQHAAILGIVLARDDLPFLAGSVYLIYSAIIVLSGFCAAAVGIEIRRHVLAGLREAATRTELAGIRQSLGVARDIQQQLLPRETVRMPAFEIAGWNRPADETGGDYYDWMHLDGGRVAVAIADVAGHGVGPALLMAICRAYARASVPGTPGLREAVVQLNRLLSADLTEGRFVTFAAAILPASGSEGIALLSAGHGPTLVHRRASGELEVLGSDGVPLGVVPEIEFDPPRQLLLAPGDVLMLVTDGFLEARDPSGTVFGVDRLAGSLHRHAGAPIEELPALLDADVRAFMGSAAQQDDMTAVVVRRTG